MWSIKVLILLFFCYACLSTGDGLVFFQSKNFYNELHWHAAQPSSPDQKVLYSVRYSSYGSRHPFQIKRECQNITARHCNLTAETPSLPDAYYLARVYANGRLHGCSDRLNPIKHTTLGQADLVTGVTPASLHVRAALPLGPNGVSVADIIRSSKSRTVNTSIKYTLHLTSPEWSTRDYYSPSAQFVFNLKSKESKYCGYVVYKPLCEWGRNESEKAYFCATLPGDPTKILLWPLMGAAILVIIMMASLGAVCVYMKGGLDRKPPRSLEIHTAREKPNLQQPPQRNHLICRATLSAQTEQMYVFKYAPARPNPNGPRVGPPGSYSPQDVPCQPCLGGTGSSVGRPNEQASSSQSSVVYSTITLAVPTEQTELLRVLVDDGEKTSPPCMEVDPCGQLQLDTVRDANGQLKLPSLAFQVESGTETKPLLSDRLETEGHTSVLAPLKRLDSSESSDSGCVDGTPMPKGCNQIQSAPLGIYLSNNLLASDANPASGYKQNWMPLDNTPKDQDYIRRNQPWTFAGPRETEEFNDDAGLRGIFLEDWVLQIQE